MNHGFHIYDFKALIYTNLEICLHSRWRHSFWNTYIASLKTISNKDLCWALPFAICNFLYHGVLHKYRILFCHAVKSRFVCIFIYQ